MSVKSDLAVQLAEQLAADERTEDVAVSILDNSGVITMSGTAPSDEAKRTAVDMVNAHEGVKSVIADIRVVDDDDQRLPGVTEAPYAPRQGGAT